MATKAKAEAGGLEESKGDGVLDEVEQARLAETLKSWDPAKDEGVGEQVELKVAEGDAAVEPFYVIQVRRNGSEWANVAVSTVPVQPDGRDIKYTPAGYTEEEAQIRARDWTRAGYEVRLVKVDPEG